MRLFYFLYLPILFTTVVEASAQQHQEILKPSLLNNFVKSTLSGRITDQKSGNPLSGASIIIHEAKTGAISNEGGYFVSPEIPSGKYLVEINYQGYGTLIQNIEISGKTVFNFN